MHSTVKSPDDADRKNDQEIFMMNNMDVVRHVVFNFDDEEVYHDERTVSYDELTPHALYSFCLALLY